MAAIPEFDADKEKPAAPREAIPAGKYQCVLSASEMKPTKAGNGEYLELVFTIIDGDHEKRKVWHRLNLINPNDQAVGIARAELKSICDAVGHTGKLLDTASLHDLPLLVKVIQKKSTTSTEMQNEIKAFEPVGGATAKTAHKPGAAPAVGSKPAWKKPAAQ
jgi:hypothetical protein